MCSIVEVLPVKLSTSATSMGSAVAAEAIMTAADAASTDALARSLGTPAKLFVMIVSPLETPMLTSSANSVRQTVMAITKLSISPGRLFEEHQFGFFDGGRFRW